jgi:hypothetical protein
MARGRSQGRGRGPRPESTEKDRNGYVLTKTDGLGQYYAKAGRSDAVLQTGDGRDLVQPGDFLRFRITGKSGKLRFSSDYNLTRAAKLDLAVVDNRTRHVLLLGEWGGNLFRPHLLVGDYRTPNGKFDCQGQLGTRDYALVNLNGLAFAGRRFPANVLVERRDLPKVEGQFYFMGVTPKGSLGHARHLRGLIQQSLG